MYDGKDVDKDSETIKERQGLQPWRNRVLLVQDESSHNGVDGCGDDAGQEWRYEPRCNWRR